MSASDAIIVVANALANLASQGPNAPVPLLDNIKVGELIRGRVLERHGDGRYLIDFGGDRRVVDSTVALAVDDVLYGRVVALGERIEIRRVRVESALTRAIADANKLAAQKSGDAAALAGVAEFVERSRARFEAGRRGGVSVPIRLRPRDAASAMLASLGIQPTPPRLAAVEEAFRRAPDEPVFHTECAPILFGTQSPAHEGEASTASGPWIAVLATLLSQALDEFLSASRPVSDQSMAARLFNVQDDSAVAHAAATLPLIVDGRLIKVDAAVFEQRADSAADGSARHRNIVLSLDLDALGHVEIRVAIAGQRAAMCFICAEHHAIEALSRHAVALRDAFSELDWSIDALRYDAAEPNADAPVPRAVFEHVTKGEQLSVLY